MLTKHVYVVMGNDYPDAVFTTEAAAEEHCKQKRAASKKTEAQIAARIHWRVYEFELRK